MKRLVGLLLTLPILFISQSASAAPKPIVVKSMAALNLATPISADTKMLVVGSSIVLLNESSIRALDSNGAEKWRISLTQGASSIATAMAADTSGNIWVAGSSANAPVVMPSAVPSPSPVNPDNIPIDPKMPTRGDLTIATIWKISNAGTLLSTLTFENSSPLLINSIALNAKGLTLGGINATDRGNSGVLLTSDLEGKFVKPIYLGMIDTDIEVVARGTDSTIYAMGSSTETLAGKKLAGYRDGIIAKYSSTGKLLALVRSSAAKAKREWIAGTNSLLLTGSVQTGKKYESAVTKFSTALVPAWTFRFASNGPTFSTAGPSGVQYVTFASTSIIKGISNWKPNKPTALVLSFDIKGALADAKSAGGTPLALGYSKELGVVLMSSSQTGVSIFRLT